MIRRLRLHSHRALTIIIMYGRNRKPIKTETNNSRIFSAQYLGELEMHNLIEQAVYQQESLLVAVSTISVDQEA